MKNINDEVSRCIIQLLLKEPFFAHLLSGIARKITTEIPTAAVGLIGNRMNLFINESFFLKELKSTSNRVAVIKHETLHLMFKHVFRMNISNYDPLLFNYAADLVVNQFIGSWDLPDSAITLSTFPDLKLKPDKSVEWYYKKLVDLKSEMEKSKNSDKGPDSSSSDWSQTSAPSSAENLSRIYGNQTHSDHSKWGAQEDQSGLSSSAQVASAESALDRIIVQARERTPVGQHGTIPGAINRLIEAILEKRKPKVDWKRALRIFSSNSRRTRVTHTMKRISKRYGTRPGIKIAHFQKIAVAIDVSGSIDNDHLSLLFSEVHGMWRQGAEIEVIECDAAVQRHYPYKGILPEVTSGGGGTNFDPVFEFLRKNRRMQFDGCIYLTDGYASEPQIKPPCRMLWVITPDGDDGKHLKFGRVIKLPS